MLLLCVRRLANMCYMCPLLDKQAKHLDLMSNLIQKTHLPLQKERGAAAKQLPRLS